MQHRIMTPPCCRVLLDHAYGRNCTHGGLTPITRTASEANCLYQWGPPPMMEPGQWGIPCTGDDTRASVAIMASVWRCPYGTSGSIRLTGPLTLGCSRLVLLVSGDGDEPYVPYWCPGWGRCSNGSVGADTHSRTIPCHDATSQWCHPLYRGCNQGKRCGFWHLYGGVHMAHQTRSGWPELFPYLEGAATRSAQPPNAACLSGEEDGPFVPYWCPEWGLIMHQRYCWGIHPFVDHTMMRRN